MSDQAEVEVTGWATSTGTGDVCVHVVDASGRVMAHSNDEDASWTEVCVGDLGQGKVLAAS